VWDSNTAPVELLTQGTPTLTGTVATVSGWGSSIPHSEETSNVLNKLLVPIMDVAECDEIYSVFGGLLENELCAGVQDEQGHEFCLGDFGGPLFVDGKLHGLVSYNYGCGYRGYPGLYTEVSALRDWILINSGV
jgi:trypsin